MKLMVVLPRVPYPLDKGDKLRAYHMLRELSGQFKIYLCCVAEGGNPFEAKENLLEFCEEVHIYPLGKMQSLVGAAQCIFTGKPLQAGYFYSKHIHNGLSEQIKRIAPDRILFQLVRTAQYSLGLPKDKLILDYMDAFSEGYKRMAEKSFGFSCWLYTAEAKRLKKYEAEVFDEFDRHLVISAQDGALIDHPMRHAIEVISNGVDTNYFKPGQHTKHYDLHFHGNMNYLPNVDCALYIANQLLPQLKQRGTQVSFLVSGAAPHAKIKALAKREGIEVTGWLEDVRIAYGASKIFVAPLHLGTGIQNKILEAMAMGMPCVVSPVAASALMLQHNQQVLIGNTTKEYCDHIELLLQDPSRGKALADCALKHVQQNFKWHDNMQKLIRFIA